MKLSPRLPVEHPRVFLVALLVLVKLALVLALSDSFFYGEELEKGAAAKAMLDGLAVPHHQLAYHYYEGGGFVISHLKALAFLLVGENLLAHKLVAIAFGVAILLAGHAFARRAFGERAALWFGVLFVFAPESFQKLSLISLGIHFEAGLFLLGVLGFGARILLGGETRWYPWFALGLSSGFGLYFSYQVGVAAAWVLLLLLVFRARELLGRGALLGLAGTLLGALPLLGMYLLVGDAIFDIHGTALGGADSLRLREFLASIFVEGALGGRVAPFAWTGAVLLSVGLLLSTRDAERRPLRLATLYLAGYLAVFLVAYVGLGLAPGPVEHFFSLLRLAPLWIFGTLLIAAALGQLEASLFPGARTIAAVLATCLLALGLRATWYVLRTGHPTTPARNWAILTRTKGYSYDQYFAKVLPHFDGDVAAKLELVEGFEEEARGWLRADAAANLFVDPGPDLVTAYGRAMEAIRARGEEREPQYVLGLGPLLVRGSDWSQERAVGAVAAAEPGARARLLEALGRFGGGRHPLLPTVRAEVERGLGLEPAAPYLRGLGRWLYGRFRLDPDAAEAFIAGEPEAARAALREGYAAERAWHLLAD